jgi:hypothetical protein
MSGLTSRYVPGGGLIIINVSIAAGGSADRSTTRSSPQFPAYPALIDTGASRSCVSQSVAAALNLVSKGMRSMISASHVVVVHSYLVDLILPLGSKGSVQSNLLVSQFVAHTKSPFQAIIGMDVISRGALTVTNDGHFSFFL